MASARDARRRRSRGWKLLITSAILPDGGHRILRVQRNRYSPALVSLVLLSVIALTGCGQANFCEVQGQAKVDGKPIESGQIMFVPVDRSGPLRDAAAEIIEGSFELTASQQVAAGTYSVLITADRSTGKKIETDPGSGVFVEEREQFIPEKYNARTELTATLAPGMPPLEFDLSVPKKKR